MFKFEFKISTYSLFLKTLRYWELLNKQNVLRGPLMELKIQGKQEEERLYAF